MPPPTHIGSRGKTGQAGQQGADRRIRDGVHNRGMPRRGGHNCQPGVLNPFKTRRGRPRAWVWKVTGQVWSCKSHGSTIGFPPGGGESVFASGRFPLCPKWSNIPGWVVPSRPQRLRLSPGRDPAARGATAMAPRTCRPSGTKVPA